MAVIFLMQCPEKRYRRLIFHVPSHHSYLFHDTQVEVKLEKEKGKRFERSFSNIKLKPVQLFCPGCCFVSPVLKLRPRTPCMPGEHSIAELCLHAFYF